jgi:arsenate reductase
VNPRRAWRAPAHLIQWGDPGRALPVRRRLGEEKNMTDMIRVYQKPTCSKCRTAVDLLRERGADFCTIDYYQERFTQEAFRALLAKLRLSPSDVLRRDEPIAHALGIGIGEMSDDELIRLMVENPDLIQRPIVVRGDHAVIARPLENLDRLL